MRPKTLAWFTLTWVVVPLGLVLGTVFLSSTFPTGTDYALAAQIRGLSAAVLVLPTLGLGAALTGARLRNSGVLRAMPLRRPLLMIFGQLLVPLILAAAVVLLFLMAQASVSEGQNAVPSLTLAALTITQCAAFASLGLGLGLALRSIVSAPLATVLPYLAIGFPPAMTPYWLRHLTWVSTSCCQVYEELQPRAVAAHFLTSVAATAIGFFLFSLGVGTGRTRVRRPQSGAIAAGAVALATAIVAALPLGVAPTQPRSGDMACSMASDVRLCLWPEHEAQRSAAESVLRSARDVAASTGAPLPTSLEERASYSVRWPAAAIEIPSAGNVSDNVISAFYPNLECTPPSLSDEAVPQTSSNNSALVHAWWLARLVGAPDVGSSLSARQKRQLTALLSHDDQTQGRTIAALDSTAAAVCGRS